MQLPVFVSGGVAVILTPAWDKVSRAKCRAVLAGHIGGMCNQLNILHHRKGVLASKLLCKTQTVKQVYLHSQLDFSIWVFVVLNTDYK